MQTQTTETRSARGRVDNGQEAVINLESLTTRMPDLLKLKAAADDAKTDYADAVKATAEKSGLLASTVRKYVNARAGDNFDEEKTKVEQLALVFEEVE